MIRARNLVKHFGTVKAVDGITLSVDEGSIITLLGPNGAGKTTTIKLLTTQLKADGGSMGVAGIDVDREPDRVRKQIGVTFQETVVDIALTGRQVMVLHAELYGMKRPEARKKTAELLSVVGLDDAADRKVSTYSGGMKRRLELSRALMTTPKALFLDEPTLGLDPQTRVNIWDYIEKLKNENGMTILLTTHYMDEAEKLSDRVYIIDNGKIIREGTPKELIQALGQDTIRLSGRGGIDGFKDAAENLQFVHYVKVSDEGLVHIGVDEGRKRIMEIIPIASEKGFSIDEIEIERPNLGDVFFNAAGRKIRE
jgi:ABC-2 type transport system ATP-binding protein